MAIVGESLATELASEAAPALLDAEFQIPDSNHPAPGADSPSAAPPQRWLKPNRFSDSIAIMLVLTAVQRLVGFGRSVLFCMFLSPFELGQWDIAFGFLLLAAPVAVLSLPAAF